MTKMTDEKPFRPSTELQNEWLTERPANLQPIHLPDNLEGMNEMMIAIREEILKRLVDGSPFGIELHHYTDPCHESIAEARHRLHKKPGRES